MLQKTGSVSWLLLTPALALAAVSVVPVDVAAQNPPATAEEREAPPLRLVQEIPLPSVQGRLDHFPIDPKRKRVIFSGLGNDSVQIVDAFAGKQIKQIDGLAEPQGTLYVPE